MVSPVAVPLRHVYVRESFIAVAEDIVRLAHLEIALWGDARFLHGSVFILDNAPSAARTSGFMLELDAREPKKANKLVSRKVSVRLSPEGALVIRAIDSADVGAAAFDTAEAENKPCKWTLVGKTDFVNEQLVNTCQWHFDNHRRYNSFDCNCRTFMDYAVRATVTHDFVLPRAVSHMSVLQYIHHYVMSEDLHKKARMIHGQPFINVVLPATGEPSARPVCTVCHNEAHMDAIGSIRSYALPHEGCHTGDGEWLRDRDDGCPHVPHCAQGQCWNTGEPERRRDRLRRWRCCPDHVGNSETMSGLCAPHTSSAPREDVAGPGVDTRPVRSAGRLIAALRAAKQFADNCRSTKMGELHELRAKLAIAVAGVKDDGSDPSPAVCEAIRRARDLARDSRTTHVAELGDMRRSTQTAVHLLEEYLRDHA
jgi:hypothetical protein